MPWVFATLGLALIVALALVLAGKLPPVPQPTAEPRAVRLPDHPEPADVDQLRLPVVFRGYRMEEVDAALMVLRNRIAELSAVDVEQTGEPDGSAQDPATDR